MYGIQESAIQQIHAKSCNIQSYMNQKKKNKNNRIKLNIFVCVEFFFSVRFFFIKEVFSLHCFPFGSVRFCLFFHTKNNETSSEILKTCNNINVNVNVQYIQFEDRLLFKSFVWVHIISNHIKLCVCICVLCGGSLGFLYR